MLSTLLSSMLKRINIYQCTPCKDMALQHASLSTMSRWALPHGKPGQYGIRKHTSPCGLVPSIQLHRHPECRGTPSQFHHTWPTPTIVVHRPCTTRRLQLNQHSFSTNRCYSCNPTCFPSTMKNMSYQLTFISTVQLSGNSRDSQ